jgi:hypothetical protein
MEPAAATCASCNKPQTEDRKLSAVGDALLCEECIDSGAALDQAPLQAPPPPARDVGSTLLDAEAMALDLIDALESSRAEQAERDLAAENEPRSRGLLRLVQAEEALDERREASAGGEAAQVSPGAQPEAAASEAAAPEEAEEQAAEAPAPTERRIPQLRFCPRCTGRLEGADVDGELPPGVTRFECESCSGRFEIREL